MTWFLVAVLALVVLVALVGVLVLAVSLMRDRGEFERARLEWDVRRAEHRLHEIARTSFAAMLDEARAHGDGGAK